MSIKIPQLNKEIGEKVKAHLDSLTKPLGSLGRLEQIAIELSEMTKEQFPTVIPPAALLFASDHGVTKEGVSAYPSEVTAQMVLNFLNGGAAMNVFCRQIGAQFSIVDVGVAAELQHEKLISRKVSRGTRNFLREDAMTRREALEALTIGREEATKVIQQGAKCLIVGEMGIGNTTSASALLAVLSGKEVAELVGPGTGLTREQMKTKQRVIEQAVATRNPDKNDPLDIVSKLGGFEIVAMAGAMLEAAQRRTPMIVDGFICTVAALIAKAFDSGVVHYMFAGHQSTEPGHEEALALLGKTPLLQLNMRLGEGTGAALAHPILVAATNMLAEMATFSEAGVSEKKDDPR